MSRKEKQTSIRRGEKPFGSKQNRTKKNPQQWRSNNGRARDSWRRRQERGNRGGGTGDATNTELLGVKLRIKIYTKKNGGNGCFRNRAISVVEVV